MSKLNKIIYLDSAEQFVELYQNGTVTKANGTVVTYNENDLYLIAKKPIVIDSELSFDSTNPVQNKVIYQKIAEVQSDVSNKIDYGSAYAYLQWLKSDMITSEAGSGDTIMITPVFIGISKNHQDGVQYSSQIFGQAPNTSPQSTNTEFYLPSVGGTLATEETTQKKLYRHTILLRDTTQDLTLRFILENNKSVGYAPSTPTIPSDTEFEELFGTLFEDIENTTDGTFRQMSGGLPYGSGIVTSNMSNFLGFDIAFFSGNVSSPTCLHMNVFDPSGASEIILEVSDKVEEL